MIELNVQRSVDNVAHSTVIQNAWGRGQQLAIYGWVYRLSDGIIKDLNYKIEGPDGFKGAHKLRPK